MTSTATKNLFDELHHGYRIDRDFGAVYDRTPAAADDLTQIRGVDTREAVILNRLGVYFFPQVALWSRHEAAAFADELGMSTSTLLDEQWIQQARDLSVPRPEPGATAHLPASAIRTVSLLACSLIAGCLIVYWLSTRSDSPVAGVLSADITSIRVPANARLMQAHVNPGDEVFSGDVLLTLEKSEHLSIIASQEKRVEELRRQLQEAQARAKLDLQWRTRELDREISDVRTRAHIIEAANVPLPEPLRAEAAPRPVSGPEGQRVAVRTVSNSRTVKEYCPVNRGNHMIFIAGRTGESSIGVPRPKQTARPNIVPQPQPLPAPESPTVLASEPRVDLLSIEASAIESRLQKLEELRDILPEQVRQAAGVESVRLQFEEAAERLENFRSVSREVDIASPGYGKVGLIRYQTGDQMSAGEVMLKILHTDRRYVLMYVPSRRVNEVEVGMEVALEFPGAEVYRGRVADLPMLADPASQSDQSFIPVRVTPTGKLWPEIPIGSQIDISLGGGSVL
ncbi:MAG: HlyD family efflux transporter periplasmic adaptor subunit [Planctomycetaceae bacterium]|nr:HlyD family efflux transporter periplasmic adaptor subunit [Planctomycetaceae bacterium]